MQEVQLMDQIQASAVLAKSMCIIVYRCFSSDLLANQSMAKVWMQKTECGQAPAKPAMEQSASQQATHKQIVGWNTGFGRTRVTVTELCKASKRAKEPKGDQVIVLGFLRGVGALFSFQAPFGA